MYESPKKPEESNSVKVGEITPEKLVTSENIKSDNSKYLTPLKTKNNECEFRSPEKTKNIHSSGDKTPMKSTENVDSKTEQIMSNDGEHDGMISTTEQARLLLAASKTPLKSVNKTPVKQSTPSGKRSIESSPGTPGKYRRVELITLASPKAKRIKEI